MPDNRFPLGKKVADAAVDAILRDLTRNDVASTNRFDPLPYCMRPDDAR